MKKYEMVDVPLPCLIARANLLKSKKHGRWDLLEEKHGVNMEWAGHEHSSICRCSFCKRMDIQRERPERESLGVTFIDQPKPWKCWGHATRVPPSTSGRETQLVRGHWGDVKGWLQKVTQMAEVYLAKVFIFKIHFKHPVSQSKQMPWFFNSLTCNTYATLFHHIHPWLFHCPWRPPMRERSSCSACCIDWFRRIRIGQVHAMRVFLFSVESWRRNTSVV